MRNAEINQGRHNVNSQLAVKKENILLNNGLFPRFSGISMLAIFVNYRNKYYGKRRVTQHFCEHLTEDFKALINK